MNRLNRRQFLKTLSFAGAGAAVAIVPVMKAKGTTQSLFLVTSTPRSDLNTLSQIIGEQKMASAQVQTSSIVPANQDISLIHNGTLIDPVKAGSSRGISKMAGNLRKREKQGEYLITVEFQNSLNSNFVEIAIDGETIERIPVQRNYSDITIPGEYGDTVFRLNDRLLSVSDAGCRHEVCKKMGNITSGRIVCAPNKLVATINGQKQNLDSITS